MVGGGFCGWSGRFLKLWRMRFWGGGAGGRRVVVCVGVELWLGGGIF